MANLLEETFENLTIDEVYEKVEWLRISFDDYDESTKSNSLQGTRSINLIQP